MKKGTRSIFLILSTTIFFLWVGLYVSLSDGVSGVPMVVKKPSYLKWGMKFVDVEQVPSGEVIRLRIIDYTYLPYRGTSELTKGKHVYVSYLKKGVLKIPTARSIEVTDDDFKWLYDDTT